MLANQTPENIVALTPENFQQIVLEKSKETLILVDFWADQIPESVQLRDKLAQLVQPHAATMILALVDCQAQQAIAQQFGIQGLPTAVLVKDGQPIDGISGPQTDETIAEFLNKHLPKAEDLLLNQGQEELQNGNINAAFSTISEAYKIDDTRADIKLTLTDIYIQLGKIESAEAILSTIMMVDQDSYYHSLHAKIELAKEASNSPEIQALELQLAEKPGDVELSRLLAVQYNQVSRQEDALALLYSLLLIDRSDADSKKLMLDILAALPTSDPITSKYRRKLFSLMY